METYWTGENRTHLRLKTKAREESGTVKNYKIGAVKERLNRN